MHTGGFRDSQDINPSRAPPPSSVSQRENRTDFPDEAGSETFARLPVFLGERRKKNGRLLSIPGGISRVAVNLGGLGCKVDKWTNGVAMLSGALSTHPRRIVARLSSTFKRNWQSFRVEIVGLIAMPLRSCRLRMDLFPNLNRIHLALNEAVSLSALFNTDGDWVEDFS